MSYPTFPVLRLLAAILGLTTAAVAAPKEERIEALFRPFLAERMTLSPNGRYIAYTEHTGHNLTVVIVDLANPGSPRRVIVEEDRVIINSTERQRATLRFLRWTTPSRLVFAPSIHVIPPAITIGAGAAASLGFAPPGPTVVSPIMAIDADGQNASTLVEAVDFMELAITTSSVDRGPPAGIMRPIRILGFSSANRERLLVDLPARRGSAAIAPIPSAAYEVNVHTGTYTKINEDMAYGPKVYDREGQPRLTSEGGSEIATELTYLYQDPGAGRWRPVQRLAGESDAAHFSVTPKNYFGTRALPLGFDADPRVMIYASNVGRDTFGIYGLNMKTMERSSLAVEHPERDLVGLSPHLPAEGLIFDEATKALVGVRAEGAPPLTIWLDRELAEAQRAFNEQFTRRSVEILEWSDDRTHFLLRVTGGTEPGRLYIFKRPSGVLTEISRSAPWLHSASLHETRTISFPGPEGALLSGYLTKPRSPRTTPIPLVIVFAAGLPALPHPEFDREAQVLADMGLAVLRLNQRGVIGRGLRQREALRGGLDRAAADDAKAAIEAASLHLPIDRKRVVAMGDDLGGFLALRACQLEPDLFRCVVATEPVVEPISLTRPPPDLNSRISFIQEANRLFLQSTTSDLAKSGVISSGDELVRPVFLVYRSYLSNSMTQGVARLRSQLKRRDLPFETVEVREDYRNGMPKARTQVYKQLEEFLNLNLYNYDVKMGPTREIR